MEELAVSDTLGHDGPCPAGDGSIVMVSVNGRRMHVGRNISVAIPPESLGYPDRGIAVALTDRCCPDPPGRQGFPTAPASTCSRRYRVADSLLTITGRSFTARLNMGTGGATNLAILDGPLAGAPEPAGIAVTGTGPVRQSCVDPAQPPLRRL
jgi:hypothetical protein